MRNKISKNKLGLSVVVIARNEEEMISDCLKSIDWLDEIIVVDTGSTDKTVEVANNLADKVIKLPFKGYRFSEWRNRGLEEAKGSWVFFIDADERVTGQLKEEILHIINRWQEVITKRDYQWQINAFAIPRRNFYLGKEVKFGGAWPDYVKRLFLKSAMKSWHGDLHEDIQFEGTLGKLEHPLLHYTHRDLASMMDKTIDWTEIEANLLFQTGHPPVVFWRIFRMMGTKFWERVVKQQAWRDGTVGWINALFEVFNTFIIYARLWEKQATAKNPHFGSNFDPSRGRQKLKVKK